VSLDNQGTWVLWNLATKTLVASGGGASDVQIAGTVFTVVSTTTVDLHDAGDGHLITSIPLVSSPSISGLASDGSYAWVRSSSDIQAWSPAGTHLFTHPGSYANSIVFGEPTQVQVGDPSSQNIEYVDATNGTSTMSAAFAGTFYGWFLDGGSFFTTVGATVRIYSNQAAQLALTSLATTENLTGQGSYFWTFNISGAPVALNIYTVAQPATPTTMLSPGVLSKAVPGGDIIGVLIYGVPNLTVVHLDPGGVSTENVPIPSAYLSGFGADAAGNWSVSAKSGAVYDRANLLASKGALSCGNAYVISGASAGLAAVGTDAGGVLTFEASSTGVTLEGAVPYKGSRVQVSDDGTVLAVQYDNDSEYWTDWSLRVFSLPSATLINTWPLQYTSSMLKNYSSISLSRGGTQIGQVLWVPSTYTRLVTDLMGATTSFMDTAPAPSTYGNTAPIFVSPNGTLVAAIDTTGAATQVFKNGALIDAASGAASGWIDDDRFLVQFFATSFFGPMYSGTAIHTVSTGTNGAMMMLPCTQNGFGVVDANHVFCVQNSVNTIYNLTTQATWTGGSTGAFSPAAVAGPYVVFENDHHIYAETYTLP
jgi:hypothetical protein